MGWRMTISCRAASVLGRESPKKEKRQTEKCTDCWHAGGSAVSMGFVLLLSLLPLIPSVPRCCFAPGESREMAFGGPLCGRGECCLKMLPPVPYFLGR